MWPVVCSDPLFRVFVIHPRGLWRDEHTGSGVPSDLGLSHGFTTSSYVILGNTLSFWALLSLISGWGGLTLLG